MLKYFQLLGLLLVIISCKKPIQLNVPTEVTPQVMCAPVTTDRAWYESNNKAPLFEGLGDYHYPITTDNRLAQKYFDQGMVLAYGFNHAEAARSFYYATKLDPNCAMAHWGYAYVLGPNYNAGMESDNYERAYEAIQSAIKYAKTNSSDKEKDLIAAMSKRYVKEPVENRTDLDMAYSEAFRELYSKYPADGNIGTLFAESLMNLHPWDLYDKTGNMKGWTPEILSILKTVIEKNPEHCGAHHFYIHAVEASHTPELGYSSAKIFDDGLVPNSGHLVHMPSHIYIRTGDYHKGSVANINAIKVDSIYVTACHAQGAYPLAYYPHNQHFLAATATLEGKSEWAIMGADQVAINANLQLMKEPGWGTLQHYYTIPLYVYVKFGKWDEILEMKNKVLELDYPQAMFHYARGMAYLGKGDLEKARTELVALSQKASNTQLREVTIWDINSVFELVQIAVKVLHAEILATENKFSESIFMLREAIDIEDQLNYNEPPDWFFSVRHHLGAIQIKANQYADAVETYKEDLQRLPRNGWALKGLSIAYSKLNELALSSEFEQAFKTAWAHGDIELEGSMIR